MENNNTINTSQKEQSKTLLTTIFNMLPNQPRSFDTADDPGFWSNGNEILCPTETDCEIVAEFLRDLLSEFSTIDVHTGYYDPFEDEKNGEQDDNTGFYYINFD